MKRDCSAAIGINRPTSGKIPFVASVVLIALAIIFSDAARAQSDYPHDVVTLVTHSSPGGGSDVFLRKLAGYLGESMGVDFVVMNVRGGSGARAMARLASAPSDGSILYATTPTYIYTSLLSRPGSTFRDLEPVVNVFFDEEVIYTRADGPFETLADVIAAAQSQRGRWGAANPASLERQALERLKIAADVAPAIVTYEGGGELALNVLNGTLDVGVGEAIELESQIQAGTLRLLAVFSAERSASFPNVPTAKEAGYDVVVRKFRGFAAPKGLSSDLIAAWEAGVQRLLDNAAYRQTSALLTPAFMPHAEYVEFIDEFAAETEDYLRESGALR
jgi:tripartite-type tricarboxylate transporter receptor subunit TctC